MDTPAPFEITVYGKPDELCFGCKKTKQMLNDAGVPFRYVDLTDEANAADLAAVKSLGFTSAPYVATSTTDWAGLQPAKVREAIEQYRAAAEAAQ